ncbi:MAG TPA: XrtA system polysaccharide deacetylase [Candidatus Binatia bacterium]|nr:XrtA system polysaccharide deacetylase [Candidatus Binatia bacterium]
MLNALTFDVEEYFQVEAFRRLVAMEDWPRLPSRVGESTRRLLDRLEARGVSATFFVVGWVADRDPALVREIARRGHELGCHGYAHRPIYAMSRAEFRDDLRRGRQAIEDASGRPVSAYRAPTCSVVESTRWALEVLADEGFRYDSSIFPIRHDRYGIPSAPRVPHRIALPGGREIVEFPMSTLRLAGQNLPFCGGGYFRLAPYELVRAGLRRLNRQGVPGMVYLHPWEIDPAQPRLPLRGLARFRHYVNLAGTESKLVRLLDDFAFAPAGRVLEAAGFCEVAA